MKNSIHLNKNQRSTELNLANNLKNIFLEVSRSDCRDVLVEFVNQKGDAKSKPLSKCLGENKVKDIVMLRFIMNDLSTKPIEVSIASK